MRMGARASPAYSFTRALAIPLASAILLPWRSCCLGDVAGCGLKRRRTIGLKGDVTVGLKGGVEEGSDPIAALADRKAASDEANPYARRRVVLAWQSAERHAPGAQLHSTRVDQCAASSRSKP